MLVFFDTPLKLVTFKNVVFLWRVGITELLESSSLILDDIVQITEHNMITVIGDTFLVFAGDISPLRHTNTLASFRREWRFPVRVYAVCFQCFSQ